MEYHLNPFGDLIVVCSVCFVSPLFFQNEIEKDLTKLGYRGDVIFDMLCVDAIGSKRFLKFYFDGFFFECTQTRVFMHPTEKLLDHQLEFYLDMLTIQDDSIMYDPTDDDLKFTVH